MGAVRGGSAAGAGADSGTTRRLVARMLIGAGAGALAILGFAPFGYWPLQILSLSILFYQVLRGATPKSGALIGWAYGFGWCAAGVHWLFIAMHRFGGMPAPLAALGVAVLALFMGGYCALAMGAAAWLRRRWLLPLPVMNLVLLPAAWALGEWLRGTLFTGFPWVAAGYAHNASPLAGFAPLLGVYGLGWLAALCGGALLLVTHRSRWLAIGVVGAVGAAGLALQHVNWTHPVGRPISVRLLQGNVAQDEKFDGAHIAQALAMYRAAITAAPADLIATPETAIALFPQQLETDYLPSLTRFAQQSGSHLLLGIPLSDAPGQYANSALGVAPDAPQPYRYDKHHLVPFGEFIPRGFRWFVELMAIPLGDFHRGAVVQPPFQVRDQRVLPNICYEDLFGEEIAAQLSSAHGAGQQPATILLNLSNLAWYGESIAIAQHLQISQMRSLETGRPMLRATNNGATAIIDGHGALQSRLPPYIAGALAGEVQGMGGLTPYIWYGNLLFLIICLSAAPLSWLLARERRKNRDQARANPA
jgi:apolipoprotein N-acyltransferase